MYQLDEIITTKKKYVCGNDKWKIIRVGADMKIECINCKRVVLIARVELEKKVNKHNNLIERVYKIEGDITELQHDVSEMKGKIA